MKVAIAGAGIGGMTLAALLDAAGHDVVLVEKAAEFGEVGAGIQISPNASRVLAAIGLADELDRVGVVAERAVLRRWQDDAEIRVIHRGRAAIADYGFPQYNVYRPDLIEILASAVGGVETRFGATVVDAGDSASGGFLYLDGGSRIEADVVVGADGIHSAVRDAVFGPSESRFSGSVAYRALIPRSEVPDVALEVTNRMGPDRHLVSYFVGAGGRFLNLVCVVPEPVWDIEGWNEPGSVEELRAQFEGWSPEVVELLDRVAGPVFRWALHDRSPMEKWAHGHVALLGDACHAMLPFMAQGACQAIEDAAVLSRVLSRPGVSSVPDALELYEQIRYPRAARFQTLSRRNATTFHLHDGPEQVARDRRFAEVDASRGDPNAWINGYDAMTVDLVAPS